MPGTHDEGYGGGGKTAKECKKMQDQYLSNRLMGMGRNEAAIEAGYAKGSAGNLTRVEHAVQQKMREKMHRAGLSDEKLIQEYLEGMELAKRPNIDGTRPLNAHAMYLKQAGFLLGYGKQFGPAVNVQVNNDSRKIEINGSQGLEGLGTEIAALLSMVRETITSKEHEQLHDGSVASGHTQTHIDVDSTATDSQSSLGPSSP